MNINIANKDDLNEILKLQKVAYQSEAELNNNYSIQPLMQTMEEIYNEITYKTFFKYTIDNEIIGSVRTEIKNGTCYVGKLIVKPKYQNQGIGSKLLLKIEEYHHDINRFELYTSNKSIRNLYLYNKNGYKEFKREIMTDCIEIIYLVKQK